MIRAVAKETIATDATGDHDVSIRILHGHAAKVASEAHQFVGRGVVRGITGAGVIFVPGDRCGFYFFQLVFKVF